MLVLDSTDAKTDAGVFAQAGAGDFEPFFFERRGRRPDGSETHVAFTLAFALDPAAPEVGFFVCEQHHPENFWNPVFQLHPNAATALATVALAAPVPCAPRAFPHRPDRRGTHRARWPGPLVPALARGRLDVMTPDDAAVAYGSVEDEPEAATLVAYSVRVEEIAAQAHRLDGAGIPYQRIGSRLVVPASCAFGVAIAFEPT